MTWEPFVVALVMTGSFAADSEPNNPCDIVGISDFVHIAGRCFYISPSDEEYTFNEARRQCSPANGLERLAILDTKETRQGLIQNRKDDEPRWVGMQPITVQIDLKSAKWVDNTSAQDVFNDAIGHEVEHVDEPRCLAFRGHLGYMYVHKCKRSQGYICESDSGQDNRCADFGKPDLLHIADRCLYISQPGELRTFRLARRVCNATLIRGRLAILSTDEILQGVVMNRIDSQFRWVGMQPITNGSDLTLAKWVDGTSAQDVFKAAKQQSGLHGSLCLAFGSEEGHVLECKQALGYICESELLITSVTSVNMETTSATLEEVTTGGAIPKWIIIVVSALAASLVIGATVPICVCLRRRYKRKSAKHVTKVMPPSGVELESSTGDSLQPNNQIQLTDHEPARSNLLEAPSTEMYAVPHMSKRGNQYSDVILDNEDVSERGLSAPKPVFKVQETERKGGVYAEVNLAEKRKYRDDGENTSECDYSTTLVENTIYGE